MKLTEQIARLLRAVYFGGNWCAVNLKDTLADLTWQQATKRFIRLIPLRPSCIIMNYYVDCDLKSIG
jgi:hypothetical protein